MIALEEGGGGDAGSDSRRISGVSQVSPSLRSASRWSRLDAHGIWIVSGAVGSNGHRPRWILFGSFPRRTNKSGETRKRESDIRAMSASVGERGSVGEGREARGSRRRRTRSYRVNQLG